MGEGGRGRGAIEIFDRFIGNDHPCFVVAEIGINHNGDVELAKQLIDSAVTAGCDMVKFQKRTVDAVHTTAELAAPQRHPSLV